MIESVDFDASPFQPGETRTLTVIASEPTTVEIRCFVEKPPPRGYRGCPECGTLERVRNRQELRVTASAELFAKGAGYLELTITDAEGDRRVIRAVVHRESESASGATSAAAMS